MTEAAKLSDAAEWPRCCEIFWNEMTWPGSSTVALPLLTTAIWYWGQRTGQVLCATVYICVCVCLCVSDTPCDLVWWLWPPGTPRQLAGTGMWRRLKDLSHLEPSSSSSNATPPSFFSLSLSLSLFLCQSHAPQVDFKACTVNPRLWEKNRRCAKLTRVKRDIFFWLTIKALLSTQSDVRVSTAEWIDSEYVLRSSFFVMDVVAVKL